MGTQEGVVPHIYVNPSQQEGQGQVKGGVLSSTSNEDTEEKNNNKKKISWEGGEEEEKIIYHCKDFQELSLQTRCCGAID